MVYANFLKSERCNIQKKLILETALHVEKRFCCEFVNQDKCYVKKNHFKQDLLENVSKHFF